MEKASQHEIYIKETILGLHLVSYLGTENLLVESLNKSGYLLPVANRFKQVHHIFIPVTCCFHFLVCLSHKYI